VPLAMTSILVFESFAQRGLCSGLPFYGLTLFVVALCAKIFLFLEVLIQKKRI
jgi:hypothetical protein